MAMHYLDYEENEEQCFKTWSAGGRRISEEDAQRVYPEIYSADYEITTDHKDLKRGEVSLPPLARRVRV